jgi:hypothetical protein
MRIGVAMSGAMVTESIQDHEELDEKELDLIRVNYLKLAEEARKALEQGKFDTGVPEIENGKTA